MLATLYDKPKPKPSQRASAGPRSSYDAAATNIDNKRHWGNADGRAAVSDQNPWTRSTLRLRSRYECLNNTYAQGMVHTRARDIVGTGPRLQLLTADAEFNAFAEAEWREWCDTVHLADTLRVLEETKERDGECFGVFDRNPDAEDKGLPALDLVLIEGDQVAHPYGDAPGPKEDDGVVCDARGRVTAYKVLKHHPGDMRFVTGVDAGADTVAAGDIVHWFRRSRPGQLRGVPELAAALPLFAYLRRIDLATLSKEEVGASLTAVLESDFPAGSEPEEYEPFEQVPIDRGMMVTLPAGQKLSQFDGNRPGATHGQYVDTVLRAIGRAVDMPFGVVAGDSSKYNYSSGRLDLLSYDHSLETQRNEFRTRVLDKIFAKWWAEFQLIWPAALLVPLAHPRRLPARQWQFDARPSIDPVKDATADQNNLANGSDSLTAICARDGRTVDDVIAERASERAKFKAAGIPIPAPLEGAPPPPAPFGAAPPGRTSGRASPPDDDGGDGSEDTDTEPADAEELLLV